MTKLDSRLRGNDIGKNDVETASVSTYENSITSLPRESGDPVPLPVIARSEHNERRGHLIFCHSSTPLSMTLAGSHGSRPTKKLLIPVESEDSLGTFFIAPPFDRLRVTAVFSVIAVSHAELVEACEEDPGKSP